MTDVLQSSRKAARLAVRALALVTHALPLGILTFSLLPHENTAQAFPIADPTNQSTLSGSAPLGTDLPSQDVKGLQTQGKLINRPGLGNGPGWTITPRLTLQELITDNAYEVKNPRRFDAATILAPGITINADTPRIQLRLDYSPSLIIHAINGPLNTLSQQLNAVGLVTVVPDLAYVDVRALSGVQSRLGGLSGSGNLGAADTGPITATSLSSGGGSYGQTGQGLNRNNLVQTSSFGISPYLLRQFKDYGTGKLGVSFNASRYNSLSGFAAAPIPVGGTAGQTLLTTEQLAQFTSGEILGRFQDTASANLSQSTSRADAVNGAPSQSFSSRRIILNNQLSYALNRVFTPQASIGYEDIQYSSIGVRPIHGITWNVGLTVTPDPDTSLTVTYGRQNGATSAAAHGRYALTARTLISLDYSNTVGTQLENLQRQLNGTTLDANGQAINAQTGGPQFLAANGLGVQTGVFRFRTFNASVQTTLTRDTLSAAFTWSEQASLSGFSNTTDYKTIAVAWSHELTPDMTFSTGASYSIIRRPAGADNAYSFAMALRYVLTPSVSLSARYTFFDRISGVPGYSMYENALLLGITKQF